VKMGYLILWKILYQKKLLKKNGEIINLMYK